MDGLLYLIPRGLYGTEAAALLENGFGGLGA